MKEHTILEEKLRKVNSTTNFLIVISFILYASVRNEYLSKEYQALALVPLAINIFLFLFRIQHFTKNSLAGPWYYSKFKLNFLVNVLVTLTLLILVIIQLN